MSLTHVYCLLYKNSVKKSAPQNILHRNAKVLLLLGPFFNFSPSLTFANDFKHTFFLACTQTFLWLCPRSRGAEKLNVCFRLQVRLVIGEKGLVCEERDVSMPLQEHKEPWFMRLNLGEEVPVFLHGDTIISDYNQIIDYLEKTFVGGTVTSCGLRCCVCSSPHLRTQSTERSKPRGERCALGCTGAAPGLPRPRLHRGSLALGCTGAPSPSAAPGLPRPRLHRGCTGAPSPSAAPGLPRPRLHRGSLVETSLFF